MFLSKKIKRLPHLFTVNLFFAQVLTCIGMILWNFVVKENNFIGQVLTFTLLCTSLYSTFIWPGLIALSLVLLKSEDLKVSPGMLVIAGWGIPALITAVLLICGEKMFGVIDAAFFYGRAQIICTTFVVAFSIFLGGGSLVCLSRGSWAQNVQTEEVNSFDSPEDPLIENEPENQTVFETDPPPRDQGKERNVSVRVGASPQTASLSKWRSSNRLQTDKWPVMCLLLTVSLLANLSSCVWLLFNHNPGRLYLELLFFCAVVNYGQGLLSFALFGLDKHLILLPVKRLYSLWYGKQEEQPQSDLSEEIRMTCTQFTKYHKQQCFHDIVKKRRCGKKTMVDCFLGCELVEWLLQVGLAQDRGEAVLYGMRLQEGGVLQHIKQEYSSQDSPLYYRFMA
uniref:integral membrane protein GPR155 n=1 Tax=Maylandia zebra TaxID=106582 RepID=UPI000D30EA64|nr:integral membrane protein GPR155-like [Maylandia zebra]